MAGGSMPAVAFKQVVNATPRDSENSRRTCLVSTDRCQGPENQFGLYLFQRGAKPNREIRGASCPSLIGQIDRQITR